MNIKEWDKVTIWNWLNDMEDIIVKWVNGWLYLDSQDVEITDKIIKEYNIRPSELEYKKHMEKENSKRDMFMEWMNKPN